VGTEQRSGTVKFLAAPRRPIFVTPSGGLGGTPRGGSGGKPQWGIRGAERPCGGVWGGEAPPKKKSRITHSKGEVFAFNVQYTFICRVYVGLGQFLWDF
jgi:hypothetical protein